MTGQYASVWASNVFSFGFGSEAVYEYGVGQEPKRRDRNMGKKNSDGISLSSDQLKKITETASRVAIEEYHKEFDRSRQENRDKRLYNTRLLMEKYRGMVKYSESAVYDAAQLEDDLDLQTLLDIMGCSYDSHTLSVQSIQERVGKVRIILDHVTRMLDYYKFRCESSGKTEIVRKWEVVRSLYLDEEIKTVQDLAEVYFVDERTIYRYNRSALQDLSALFFGWVD